MMPAPDVLVIYGTRPEVIKLAPVIWALRGRNVHVVTCATGQHRELIAPLLTWFGIENDFDLELMRPGQSLVDLTASALEAVSRLIQRIKPRLIVVQGDTSTAFAGALAGYLNQVPVAHVEAGLRTGNLFDPYPEEANRKMISAVTGYHFAPTASAQRQLLAEGIAPASVFLVGNTVIDALLWTATRIDHEAQGGLDDGEQRLILVTAHRRESFGAPLDGICRALLSLIERNPELRIVFPVHPNPQVREKVHQLLGNEPRIQLFAPLDYQEMVLVLAKSYLVLTDSGGLQEEAPALGKPVLVLRNTTERPEAVEAGAARLVGTGHDTIVHETEALLRQPERYAAMARVRFPFGDGHSAERIARILKDRLTTP